MGALNRPEPVLWITLAAIPANALLVYLLIHGVWGLPPLGLFGAGHRHHDRQFRDVPGRAVVCRRAPAVLEISRAGTHLAHRLGDDAAN